MSLDDIFKSLPAGLNEGDVNEVRESFLPHGRPGPPIDEIYILNNLHLNWLILLDLLLTLLPLCLPHRQRLLIGHVLQVTV